MSGPLLWGAKDLQGSSCLGYSVLYSQDAHAVFKDRSRFPRNAIEQEGAYREDQNQGDSISLVKSDILKAKSSDIEVEDGSGISSSGGYITDDELLKEDKLAACLVKEERAREKGTWAASKPSHKLVSDRLCGIVLAQVANTFLRKQEFTTGRYSASDENTTDFDQRQIKKGKNSIRSRLKKTICNSESNNSLVLDIAMPPALEDSPASQQADDEMYEDIAGSSPDGQAGASEDPFEPRVVSDIGIPVPERDPSPPVKRGRGRPPKNRGLLTAATDNASNTEPIAESDVTNSHLEDANDKRSTIVKRGRGRPPKNRGLSKTAFDNVTSTEPMAESDAAESNIEHVNEKGPAVFERGKGRPTKKIIPSWPIGAKASSASEDGDDDAGDSDTAESQVEVEQLAPAKRGRGRPSKKRSPSEKPTTNTTVKKQRTTTSAVPPGTPERRRSTRVQPSDQGSSSAVKSDSLKASSPRPRSPKVAKSGRPRKGVQAVKTPAKKPKYTQQDTEEEWEVESIEDSLIDRQGGVHYYKVKWKGFPASANTWEPRVNLAKCQNLIDAYQERNKKTRKSRK